MPPIAADDSRSGRQAMQSVDAGPTCRRLKIVTWFQAGVWTLLILLSLGWNLIHSWNLLTDLALTQGRIAFEKDLMYRRWNAGVSPVYVRVSDEAPPNPHLADWPERDITTPAGQRLTLMNPAYMTRLVHELGELESGVRSHITSLEPLRPENRPDEWERVALERMKQGLAEVSEIKALKSDGNYMRVIRPLRTEKVCLKCHEDQGYEEGDLRGAISVSVPLAPMEAAFLQHLWKVGSGHLVLWLVVLGLLAWSAHRIHEQMGHRFEVERELLREKDAQQRLILQLKTTQGQLLQSEKLASIGQLAAGVAHEINNPIAYIHSNLNTLKSYLADMDLLALAGGELETELSGGSPALSRLRELKRELGDELIREDAANLVNECREGIERVKKIVVDLKTFARPNEEAWVLTDLHKNLASTLNIVHNELRNKARLETDYANLPEIRCMPGKLNQVFLNLLMNAAQAIADQGVVWIRTLRVNETHVAVEIRDNGCGIAKEHLPRLFEPFFTTKPEGQGTGLGLSISYGIVKDHGGAIEVSSTPGKGACFRVLLPIEQ
jgi:two-component system NtrC family sensor kinase